jgi:hypothetical protein
MTLALCRGELPASRPGHFTPGESTPGTNWICVSLGTRTGLDDVERRKTLPLPELEPRPLGSTVRSQPLYRLHSPRCYYQDKLTDSLTSSSECPK